MCVIAVTHRRYTYLAVLQRQTQIRIDEGNCRTTQQRICSLEEAPKYCNMKPQQQTYIYRCHETLTSSVLLYLCVRARNSQQLELHDKLYTEVLQILAEKFNSKSYQLKNNWLYMYMYIYTNELD